MRLSARRELLGQAGSAAAILCVAPVFAAPTFAAPIFAASRSAPEAKAEDRLAALERRSGGRLGVAALDTGTQQHLAYRGGQRFAMCSTFKMMAAAAVLARVDQRRERLDRMVHYSAADLLDYAPAAKARLGEGGMTMDALCAAAVELSDNTAANLILASLGGPAGVTAFARSIGDRVFRLDHSEPALNMVRPGETHDTTTPDAMVASLRRVLLGDALSVSSRGRLVGWMKACKTGDARLRAGAPKGWTVADKTGTWNGAGKGTANDIGLLFPPSRAPIVAAVFLADSPASAAERDAVISGVGGVIAQTFSHAAAAHG